MKLQREMAKAGRVSFWLGDGIANGREMDAYMSSRFAEDFGFVIDPPSGPETSPDDWSKPAPRQSIDALLAPFSFSETWLAAAVALAAERGWRDARDAIVFFAFEYDATLTRNREAPMTFVGTVDFGNPR